MNRKPKTICTILLTIGIAFTATACGKQEAKEPPKPDVISVIREKCNIRPTGVGSIVMDFWNYETNDNKVQCLLNAMPDDVYKAYDSDKGVATDQYMDDGEPTYSASMVQDGYKWGWTMYTFGGGISLSRMTTIRVEKS